MRTCASVIKAAPGRYEIMEVELGEPEQGEIQVRMAATGLCHSDDHLATGDVQLGMFPMIGGHEGAGIVEQVGAHTPGFDVGDHVVFSFLPSCGRCRWCANGMQNLCDAGASTMLGTRSGQPDNFRFHGLDGRNVGQMAGLGTFSEHTVVSVMAAVKVPKDLSLTSLCLLGCAVGTGWGSAVNSAATNPGDAVIVMGVGGVGINAIQGAASAGATYVVGVDPVAFKRQKALDLGATHCFPDIASATEFVRSKTNGQGADSAILTMGVVEPNDVRDAMSAIRKAGTVVVTGLARATDEGVPISLVELTLFQKRIQGSLYGQTNANADIARQIDMYREGKLKLDELITTTYTLDEVAKGYDDMHAGKNLRGVVVFD